MTVHVSPDDPPGDFTQVGSVVHKRAEGAQRYDVDSTTPVRHVKLRIEDAHGPFCAVSRCDTRSEARP